VPELDEYEYQWKNIQKYTEVEETYQQCGENHDDTKYGQFVHMRLRRTSMTNQDLLQLS